VDRDDVIGALDAFVDGTERRVDLAEVNGRVFVNNVSLGLYADAVQRPGYREAKLHTLLDTVPAVLGPEAAPANLRYEGPSGSQSAVAILVSNNSYRLGRALGSGTRPRLDRGLLASPCSRRWLGAQMAPRAAG
jgi:diacylglycerol kinase family enzyme